MKSKALIAFLTACVMACGHGDDRKSKELAELRQLKQDVRARCAAMPLRASEMLRGSDAEVVAAGAEAALWVKNLCPDLVNEAQMMDYRANAAQMRQALTSISQR